MLIFCLLLASTFLFAQLDSSGWQDRKAALKALIESVETPEPELSLKAYLVFGDKKFFKNFMRDFIWNPDTSNNSYPFYIQTVNGYEKVDSLPESHTRVISGLPESLNGKKTWERIHTLAVYQAFESDALTRQRILEQLRAVAYFNIRNAINAEGLPITSPRFWVDPNNPARAEFRHYPMDIANVCFTLLWLGEILQDPYILQAAKHAYQTLADLRRQTFGLWVRYYSAEGKILTRRTAWDDCGAPPAKAFRDAYILTQDHQYADIGIDVVTRTIQLFWSDSLGYILSAGSIPLSNPLLSGRGVDSLSTHYPADQSRGWGCLTWASDYTGNALFAQRAWIETNTIITAATRGAQEFLIQTCFNLTHQGLMPETHGWSPYTNSEWWTGFTFIRKYAHQQKNKGQQKRVEQFMGKLFDSTIALLEKNENQRLLKQMLNVWLSEGEDFSDSILSGMPLMHK